MQFLLSAGEHLFNLLLVLFDTNQCGVVAVRRVIDQLNDENALDFYASVASHENGKAIMEMVASLGIIPHLLPDMISPLALTEDQKEYANPEAASAFLAAAFGASQNPDAAAIVARMGVTQPALIQNVDESTAFSSSVLIADVSHLGTVSETTSLALDVPAFLGESETSQLDVTKIVVSDLGDVGEQSDTPAEASGLDVSERDNNGFTGTPL